LAYGQTKTRIIGFEQFGIIEVMACVDVAEDPVLQASFYGAYNVFGVRALYLSVGVLLLQPWCVLLHEVRGRQPLSGVVVALQLPWVPDAVVAVLGYRMGRVFWFVPKVPS